MPRRRGALLFGGFRRWRALWGRAAGGGAAAAQSGDAGRFFFFFSFFSLKDRRTIRGPGAEGGGRPVSALRRLCCAFEAK